MKAETLITIVLIISMVFFIYAEMVREANESFEGTTDFVALNSSEWDEQYDMIDDIYDTLSPIEERFKKIKDPETGFFTKLYLGIAAIPYAIMLVPETLFNSIFLMGNIITSFATFLNIPNYIVLIFIMMLLSWAIFRLLEYFQRSKI